MLICHATVFPEILPMMMENNAHGPWNRLATLYDRYQNLQKIQELEEQLRQYRTYLINMIYENNNDICNLYDYITDNSGFSHILNNDEHHDVWTTHDLIDNDSKTNKGNKIKCCVINLRKFIKN